MFHFQTSASVQIKNPKLASVPISSVTFTLSLNINSNADNFTQLNNLYSHTTAGASDSAQYVDFPHKEPQLHLVLPNVGLLNVTPNIMITSFIHGSLKSLLIGCAASHSHVTDESENVTTQ